MRDFDQELQEDLTFKIRGEMFEMKYVRPEVLAEWEDVEAAEVADADGATAVAAIARLDRRVESFLRDEDVERWRALRAREDQAVPFVQLRELVKYMVEVQSHRPTETPSASAGGRGRTGASSTARSRSQAAA